MRITIFNEFHHERHHDAVKAVYPDGIHQTLARALQQQIPHATINTATQDQPDHGLTPSVLNNTDVLLWWGHRLHDAIDDAVVDRVHTRVLEGMGIVFLHSAH